MMRLIYNMVLGGLSLALLGGAAEPVYAKPERHDIEQLLPHHQIKRHIEHKRDKIKHFIGEGSRTHHDTRQSQSHHYDKRGKQGKRKYPKHDRHHYHQYGDRYYSHSRHHRHHYHDEYSHYDRYHYKRYPYPRYYSGFWHEHRRHGYHHKRHNGYHYYYDRAGFFFPGLGVIKHGHQHGRHCPDWHLEPFVAGVVLSAILSH